MSYDLLVSISPLAKHSPAIVGAIEFDELTPLKGIAERHRCWLFDRLLNYYEDQSFTIPELHKAVDVIDCAILAEHGEPERRILYKISAIFSMAIRKNLPAHGVAD